MIFLSQIRAGLVFIFSQWCFNHYLWCDGVTFQDEIWSKLKSLTVQGSSQRQAGSQMWRHKCQKIGMSRLCKERKPEKGRYCSIAPKTYEQKLPGNFVKTLPAPHFHFSMTSQKLPASSKLLEDFGSWSDFHLKYLEHFSLPQRSFNHQEQVLRFSFHNFQFSFGAKKYCFH